MAKNVSDDVKISKAMSWLLRHGAEKEGIQITNDGFVKLDDLLAHRTLTFTNKEQIFKIVESSEKKRFHIENFNNETYIRANQGHSLQNIKVDMTEITDPSDVSQCIHGTYYKFWDLIKQKGLSKMSRQHIHLAEGMPGSDGVISGMRKNCQIAIYVNVVLLLKDGLKLYRSANNVLLCPGNEDGYLEPKYFSEVKDLKKGVALDF